jgi:hypothetical protein
MKPQEKILREYIKQYLKELKEVETETGIKNDTEEEKPAQEEPTSSLVEPLVAAFTRKVKNNITDINNEVIQEILVEILDAFTVSTDEKLNIIRNVKNTIANY